MIWGRSATNNSRMCLHMPLEHTVDAVTGLHIRPIASMTAPINRSRVAQSKIVEPSLIGVSTRLHAPLTPSALSFTRHHVQPIVYVTTPIGRFGANSSRSTLISPIWFFTSHHARPENPGTPPTRSLVSSPSIGFNPLSIRIKLDHHGNRPTTVNPNQWVRPSSSTRFNWPGQPGRIPSRVQF